MGITIGCLLGMIPLMFMKEKKAEKDGEKDKQEVKKENESPPAK